jgi:hypothetical protein
MPFCPSCQSEYRPGFTRCKDCDVALVESLPDAEPEEGINTAVELVELATFPDAPEAEMICELLEENGIATVLRSDASVVSPLLGFPATLLVSREDEERARALYEEYFAGDEAAEASGQEDDDPGSKEEIP